MFLFIVATGYAQAQVYRSVDKDGNVIFTDQATEGAVKVEIKELETIKSLETTSPAPSQAQDQTQEKIYDSLEITNPQNDLAIRENAGNLTVTVAVTPELRSGDNLMLYLDGTKYASGQSTSFQLQNIDRGTHQLRVAISDRDGQEQISSTPVSFHMLRYSVANPSTAKPTPKPSRK
ncbi:MAG: hypothetical protein HW386_2463 [Gammaproteobacteria bacterium]|nr:hypothetical protein [Gammaproteobacteria bacterium]